MGQIRLLALFLSCAGTAVFAAPPHELAQLSYEAAVAEVEALSELKTKEINRAYQTAVLRLAEQAKDAGNFKVTVRLIKEQERWAQDPKHLIQPLDEEPAWLKKVRHPYASKMVQLNRAVEQRQSDLKKQYLDKLEAMKVDLTRKRKLQEALLVEAEQKRVLATSACE